jgi:peroxiredoxin
VELQGRLAELRRGGLGVAAISYDSAAVLADFAKRRGITFPLLSDAGSTVIKAFGILNTTVPVTSAQQYGIPFPGTFMVDRGGVVTTRVFEEAYQERDTIASVMVRLGNTVSASARKITTPHVQLTTYVTDAVVAPGTRFSLVLDVKPGRRMHVYAPGVEGYKPIALSIAARAGVLVRNAQFPQPEEYHFKPLDERVQVYQKDFRIVQDLTIDPSPQAAAALNSARDLTIEGVLEYQACDDAICYLPQSIPLSWTVTVKPLDRERASPR